MQESLKKANENLRDIHSSDLKRNPTHKAVDPVDVSEIKPCLQEKSIAWRNDPRANSRIIATVLY